VLQPKPSYHETLVPNTSVFKSRPVQPRVCDNCHVVTMLHLLLRSDGTKHTWTPYRVRKRGQTALISISITKLDRNLSRNHIDHHPNTPISRRYTSQPRQYADDFYYLCSLPNRTDRIMRQANLRPTYSTFGQTRRYLIVLEDQ